MYFVKFQWRGYFLIFNDMIWNYVYFTRKGNYSHKLSISLFETTMNCTMCDLKINKEKKGKPITVCMWSCTFSLNLKYSHLLNFHAIFWNFTKMKYSQWVLKMHFIKKYALKTENLQYKWTKKSYYEDT